MSAYQAALSRGLARTTARSTVRAQPRATRHYANMPYAASVTSSVSSGSHIMPVFWAGGGAAGVLGVGLYTLGRDSRGLQHSDHLGQQAINPKRKYRDSRGTRWVDWHV